MSKHRFLLPKHRPDTPASCGTIAHLIQGQPPALRLVKRIVLPCPERLQSTPVLYDFQRQRVEYTKKALVVRLPTNNHQMWGIASKSKITKFPPNRSKQITCKNRTPQDRSHCRFSDSIHLSLRWRIKCGGPWRWRSSSWIPSYFDEKKRNCRITCFFHFLFFSTFLQWGYSFYIDSDVVDQFLRYLGTAFEECQGFLIHESQMAKKIAANRWEITTWKSFAASKKHRNLVTQMFEGLKVRRLLSAAMKA